MSDDTTSAADISGVGSTDLLGDEALALGRWLAQAYREMDECRYAAIALRADECN